LSYSGHYFFYLIDESDLEHNHDEETKQIVRQVIRTATKRKAIEDTSVRPSKIVISEIENCTSVNTDLLLFKDINQLRDNVHRARRQI